jgi:radical SAM-linked protein
MSYLYRINYRKDGPLIFISQLDLNSLVRRILLRAKIPVELTQGYNPRMKISFAPALPLGMEGWQEILDVYLIEQFEPQILKEKINAVAPVGFKVLAINKVLNQEEPLNKLLQFASYLIYLINTDENIDKGKSWEDIIKIYIHNFLEQKNIIIKKETKRGIKEINLRPLIQKLAFVSEEEDRIVIQLIIDIQQVGSINPCLIVNRFLLEVGEKIRIEKIVREKFIIYSKK